MSNIQQEVSDEIVIISPQQAESDNARMRKIMHKGVLRKRAWLTNLLFGKEWGPVGKPSLFLSYPKSGIAQAEVIKRALRRTFHCIDWHEWAGPERSVTKRAIESIQNAQCFIGIWHPEKESTDTLSAWMPFEYGVAMSSKKPILIVHDARLPERIIDRIDRDSARISYGDLTLASESSTVEKIVLNCEDWAASHRTLTIT